jgi:uncharacterized membrane protein
MPQFPPIPTWDSLHPLVIHFPIALLLLSPLFVLIGATLSPPKGQPYMTAALIILLLGTISLFVAAATGEQAAMLADRGGPVDAVLAAHEHLASETEIVFSALSVVLVGMIALPRFFRYRETRLISTFLPLAFLVLYSAGIVFVVNTAHEGGRLVHQYGVHAMIPAQSNQPLVAPASGDSAAQIAVER